MYTYLQTHLHIYMSIRTSHTHIDFPNNVSSCLYSRTLHIYTVMEPENRVQGAKILIFISEEAKKIHISLV